MRCRLSCEVCLCRNGRCRGHGIPADATKLLTAITFAGLGGFWTLFYSYWLRDKGSGMAHYMGTNHRADHR